MTKTGDIDYIAFRQISPERVIYFYISQISNFYTPDSVSLTSLARQL